MTLILKITSHETASQYIMLEDFAFKQVLEFALTFSSCYKIIGSKVYILLSYCRSLKTTPKKLEKHNFTEKWTWWYFFSNEHTSHKFILVITVNCAKQLISTLEASTQGPKKLSFEIEVQIPVQDCLSHLVVRHNIKYYGTSARWITNEPLYYIIVTQLGESF